MRESRQRVATLQADLARAECLMDSHAVAKMKLPLFPMSPLATPPIRHDKDKDKENSGRPAKTTRPQVAATLVGIVTIDVTSTSLHALSGTCPQVTLCRCM